MEQDLFCNLASITTELNSHSNFWHATNRLQILLKYTSQPRADVLLFLCEVILLFCAFCAQHIKGALLLSKLILFRLEQLNF